MSEPSFSAHDFAALLDAGAQVFDDLLPSALVLALRTDCLALETAGRLQPARVGRLDHAQHHPGIRGDSTFWIEPDPAAPVRAELLGQLDALRISLNRRFMLGLETVEAHYALYPPGARYARHLDRFRDDDSRTLSFTCYLNEQWQSDQGGELRLWLQAGPQDVLPLLGHCVLFLSAEIEHEVLPATRPRYSISGWFRRRPPRSL